MPIPSPRFNKSVNSQSGGYVDSAAAIELISDRPASEPICSEGQVGFVVINYNTAAETLRCIESLAICTVSPTWILVLDNASARQDLDALESGLQSAPHSHIKLFRSNVNLGFAAGSNFLIDQLLNLPNCQYVGLLNSDAIAKPELVQLLRDALTTATGPVGMSGGRVHQLGDPQAVDNLGITIYASLMPADRKNTDDPYLGPTGGCCLMSREFVMDVKASTGYCFDGRFFCYCEDLDLALRCNLLGYKPAYVDHLVALHEGQASSRTMQNSFIAYHSQRNNIWMQLKFMPTSILLKNSFWWLLAHALTIARHTVSGRPGLLWLVYRDAFWLLPAMLEERAKFKAAIRLAPGGLSTVISKHFFRQGFVGVVFMGWLNSWRGVGK